jgi:uncharacterized protein (TIGR02270 family)
MNTSGAVIPHILDQHAEEAAFLWLLRDAAVSDPHYSLKDLADLDNRVEAHLDGLRIAGDGGWKICHTALDTGEPGEVFAAAVLAFEGGDGHRVEAVIQAASTETANFRALVSALGWVEYRRLEGLLEKMLAANSEVYRHAAIAACGVHRRDPGKPLQLALQADSPAFRARALKAVGELNRRDLLKDLRGHWQSEDEACRFWSTWSSALLGDTNAVKPLMAFVNFGTRFGYQALHLAIRLLDHATAKNWMKGLWQEESQRRYAMIGAGMSGDPQYIPALIKQMAVPELARVAGEAFSLITGVDLAYQDLEGEWPEGFEAGPTENPEDDNVEMDADEDLPWPEPALVATWWEANQQHFTPGARYLCGQPVSVEHCATVLRTGFQRQRTAAATELALLSGDGGLFETRAPGFRQRTLLGPDGQQSVS